MKKVVLTMMATGMLLACNEGSAPKTEKSNNPNRFADLEVLTYEVPGFEKLSARQKELVFYLYQAALSGRDIIWDQRYEHNLRIRKTIEAIVTTYSGDKNSAEWEQFMTWAKRVWFSNGIHHHYSNLKIQPEFKADYLKELLSKTTADQLPLEGQSLEDFTAFLSPILFDPNVAPKMLEQSGEGDLIKQSSVNFYQSGLTQKEVEAFYATRTDRSENPVSTGLNSKVVKENGQLTEKVWKSGGMYGAAIDKIIFWLEKAITVAENPEQQQALTLLVDYYKTGDLKRWDDYNISWVKDVNSVVDVVNGFIEVYADPLGKKASYESVVSIKDMEASKTIETIAKEAQWFEDNSPIMKEHKKPTVQGITAKVITVVVEAGDAAPSTPIGINLPNANWIRKEHGSKSVSLGNIVNSYNVASAKSPVLSEFAYSTEIVNRIKEHGNLAGNLHTDMHEVIGHASGQLQPGVGQPDETLKNYNNTLEEARADLVALYYIMDQKLVDIGVMPSLEVGKAEYDSYVMNGLITQLTRLKQGENLEEAHMKNRQLVAKWAYEKGKADNVIEFVKQNGKTYVKINDYNKLRTLFGELLKEIQRIKSTGDFKAAKALVENYGTRVDQDLLKEVLDRYAKLNVAPYKGFIQPKLVPVMSGDKITDVKVEPVNDFVEQMLYYGKEYSFLPTKN